MCICTATESPLQSHLQLVTYTDFSYCFTYTESPILVNSTSPPLHISTPLHSTPPHLHPSTLHPTTSPPLHISTTPHLHPSTSPPFHISTPPHLHPATSPPLHILTPPHLHISTSPLLDSYSPCSRRKTRVQRCSFILDE